jgi:HlyD family secretion protein
MKILGSVIAALRRLFLLAACLLLLSGATWGIWHWKTAGTPAGRYRTQPVSRGHLVATINATGTLVPEEVIDVGAQVAGQILRFGRDLDDPNRTIDYRSRVEGPGPGKEGTILAQIDDSLYQAARDIAKANLAVAEADVEKAQSDLAQIKVKLDLATRDWDRAQRMAPGGAIAQADYDTYRNAYQTSNVAVPGAEASLLRARRNVEMAKATLQQAETNLRYTTIRSPVDGVIIDRRVNIGQTVIASLNAPSLFLIAKNLQRMQVWATVNEADIGVIHPGQTVSFTVDAFPHDVFSGQVAQIRFNASMNQNVVTYTVVVNTDNTNLKLLPYLTANAFFKVDERSQALQVPNAALRWRPQASQVAPEYRDAFTQAQRRKELAAEGHDSQTTESRRQPRGTVWVEDNGFVRPIKVRTGLTDGSRTEVVEVLDAELLPDTQLVTGEARPAAGANGAAENPFTPKMFSGKKD